MKKLRITVEGKVYEVSVEILNGGQAPAAPVFSAPLAGAGVSAPVASAPAAKAAGGPDVVPSSLAGKVVSIQVTVGQEVKQGQELMTLEAMKMNTFVYAPKAGKVAEILVSTGDGVAEGQGLVRIS